jgi:hypothetical protein
MTETTRTFKSFEERPGHTPCRLPPLLDDLVGGQCLPAYFGPDDLREMAKFGEIPNVHGLAAYRIERPAPPEYDPADSRRSGGAGEAGDAAGALAPIPELPAGVGRPLANRLAAEPLVMAQGVLLPERDAPLRARAIVPQSHAHLAAALRAMLHPWPADEEPGGGIADYTLLIWPAALRSRRGEAIVETLIGHWPASARVGAQGVGLTIGDDDPSLAARLLIDAVRRRLAGEGSGAALETGGSEPRVVDGNRVRSLWAAPLAAVADLAATEEGRRRALAVGTWLYGVADDGAGHFPALEGGDGDDGGWAVTPRV